MSQIVNELFPIKEVFPRPILPLNLYIVVSFWKGGWWKIFQSFDSLKEAEEEAERLSPGYGKRIIFHLNE